MKVRRSFRVLTGVVAACVLSAGCELVQGLEPATLGVGGGGGAGAAGGTGGSGGDGGTTGSTTTSSTGTSCEPGKAIACYTGAPGTESVGICKPGEQTCKPDGSGYEEACVGEQPPSTELCASPADENCDGRDCVIWAGVWGDENEQLPLDIDTDAEGNVYVLGAFQGAIKLSDPALISAGGWDLFLTKLDASGAVLWSKQFGNAADQNAGQIAVSAAGDIVVAGKLTGAINFGGGVLQGKDVFVARFSTDGTHVWSEAFQVGAPTQVEVATGPDGAVFLWTDFLGTAAFGGPGLSAPSDRNAVLVGLSADTGAFAWQKPFVSTSQSAGKKDTTIRSIDTDSAGNITASGYFLGSKINLGGSDLLEGFPGGGGSFMGRFDSMGGHAWSVGNVFLGEISADPLGAIAAVSVDDPANRGCNSGFVTRYSTVGSKVWEKTIGCPKQGDDVLSISGASDPFGAVDVAVAVESSSIPFTFGQGVLPSIGTVDLALGKFDSKGDHVWSRRFGVPEEVQASPVIAIAPNGDVVMAAQVSGPIDVGTGPLPSLPGAKDLLIARFGQ